MTDIVALFGDPVAGNPTSGKDAPVEVPPVRLDALGAETVVCDLVPDRLDTPFLAQARALGHRTINGLPMLARLAAAGFAAWTGRAAPIDVLRAELERAVA